MTSLMDECIFTWSPRLQGPIKTNGPEYGTVECLHPPTGIVVLSEENVSAYKGRKQCLEKLTNEIKKCS